MIAISRRLVIGTAAAKAEEGEGHGRWCRRRTSRGQYTVYSADHGGFLLALNSSAAKFKPLEHPERNEDKLEDTETLGQFRERLLQQATKSELAEDRETSETSRQETSEGGGHTEHEGIENQHLRELGFTDDALEPYYAGLVASDGHIEHDNNRSVVASSNHEFVTDVVEPVLEEQGIEHSTFWDEGAGVYKISINNDDLWDTLTEKYDIPSGAKAESIEPPEGLTDSEELWFIRGWFDGEGWPEEMSKEYGDTEYIYPRVGFKVMSEDIRDWVAVKLEERDIRVSTYNRADGSHGLWINGYEECGKFDQEIGFRHPEQDRKLKELLANRESRSEARGTG